VRKTKYSLGKLGYTSKLYLTKNITMVWNMKDEHILVLLKFGWI